MAVPNPQRVIWNQDMALIIRDLEKNPSQSHLWFLTFYNTGSDIFKHIS